MEALDQNIYKPMANIKMWTILVTGSLYLNPIDGNNWSRVTLAYFRFLFSGSDSNFID